MPEPTGAETSVRELQERARDGARLIRLNPYPSVARLFGLSQANVQLAPLLLVGGLRASRRFRPCCGKSHSRTTSSSSRIMEISFSADARSRTAAPMSSGL